MAAGGLTKNCPFIAASLQKCRDDMLLNPASRYFFAGAFVALVLNAERNSQCRFSP
jgi:hypothetical protein